MTELAKIVTIIHEKEFNSDGWTRSDLVTLYTASRRQR
jgi:hypothetical protein